MKKKQSIAGREIGYPLMLKASAGGGGIGMQLVHSEEELQKPLLEIKKGPNRFSGMDDVFRKVYQEPHHIEVQILADTHGNVIPLLGTGMLYSAP